MLGLEALVGDQLNLCVGVSGSFGRSVRSPVILTELPRSAELYCCKKGQKREF